MDLGISEVKMFTYRGHNWHEGPVLVRTPSQINFERFGTVKFDCCHERVQFLEFSCSPVCLD